MEHIQTSRKPKSKSNIDSDGWFGQDDDEDSISQPFEKASTFTSDGIGRPVEDRVTLLEAFLKVSTTDQKEISKVTGKLLKESKVAQEYLVTVMNEITGIVGIKSAKFSAAFDQPSLWFTIELLGNFVANSDSNIPSIVAKAISTKQNDLAASILLTLWKEFVSDIDWMTFLRNFGLYMTNEAADKKVYHQALLACTSR